MSKQPSFYEQIAEESRHWETEGILTPEQRLAILNRYEIPESPADAQGQPHGTELPLFIRVLFVLAVVLIGMAVFLLIGFNWKQLSGEEKLSIVGGALAASYAAGIALRARVGKYWSEAAFFFSGIMFGVAIWQIGQVFHLPADFPLGLLLWGTGVFLLALALGSTPLHFLSVALLGGWVLANIFGMNVSEFVWWREFAPVSSFALPVFAAIGILSGMIRKHPFVPILYTLLFLFWWIFQGIPCGLSFWMNFHVAVVGLICIAASDWLPKRNSASISLWRLGAVLFLGGLIAPSFGRCWQLLLYHGFDTNYRHAVSPEIRMVWNFIFLALDLLILFGFYAFPKRKQSQSERLRNNAVLLTVSCGTAAIWIIPRILSMFLSTPGGRSYYSSYNQPLDPFSVFLTLAVNLLMLIFMVWMIQTGLKRKSSAIFFSGVVFFLIWAVIRYCDLFAGVGGMLGAAGVFFFCALVLLGIAYYWVTRQPKIEAVDEDDPDDAFPVPAWFTALQTRLERFRFSERKMLVAVVAVALLQFGILGAMVGKQMVPHVTGTTITVAPVPVDPRDLFRGDYVILNYPFSSTSQIPNPSVVSTLEDGRTVYVSMIPDGDIWKASGISATKPKEGVFLRGTLKKMHGASYGGIVYGIESYFVQEGTGRELENAMRAGRNGIRVDLVVAPSGQVSLKTVRIVP